MLKEFTFDNFEILDGFVILDNFDILKSFDNFTFFANFDNEIIFDRILTNETTELIFDEKQETEFIIIIIKQ